MTEYEDQLGTYQHRPYFVHLRGEPSLSDPVDFAAVVYYKEGDSEKTIEIVRIDNSHDRPHIDRLYRRDVGKKPDFDGGLWDAFAQLKANWKEYAQRFEEVHGWPDNQP